VDLLNRGDSMKCIACGREMIDNGNHWECSNLLCDYEEETDTQETLTKEQQILHFIFLYELEYNCSFVHASGLNNVS